MTLFEFASEKGVQNWYSLDDTIMVGVSSSQMSYAEGGIAKFHGEVSLENNGGFASVRYDKTSFDLCDYSGVEIRVKGDNKTYQFRLGTNAPRIAYAQPFHAPNEWTTVQLPFTNFKPTFRGRAMPSAPELNSSSIQEVTFMLASKQAGSFELFIDWVKAYA